MSIGETICKQATYNPNRIKLLTDPAPKLPSNQIVIKIGGWGCSVIVTQEIGSGRCP